MSAGKARESSGKCGKVRESAPFNPFKASKPFKKLAKINDSAIMSAGKARESAGKCGEVRESAGKYGKVRESAGKYGKVRESAGKCALQPFIKLQNPLKSLHKSMIPQS